MNVKAISANVGKALLVSALFMLLSCGVSIFYGLDSSFAPLLLSFIITFSVGIFPLIFVRDTPALRMHEAFVTIVLSWLVSFLLGMLPYVLWGGEFSVINAWFESVSGYTTTGATILKNVEALPKGLLFWRSSTQYIGGFGVVVFLMMILPTASPLRMKLANLEISSLSRDGYSNRSAIAAKIMLSVYLGLSLLCFLSFLLAGMPIFDAINHTLTVLPNGGFSVKNASIGYYDSTWINLIVMFFTTLCAIHFGQLYTSFATRSFKPLNNPVVKYFLGCI
ncbi:MAG: TrkH family potassium uptake protein, partial [Bacteroidales bacterium]|nr:TrkH family potassium uptake protein [Bacteroidales bacterium]